MADCELCGRETNLVTAFIEGVRLRVCSNCGKHGKTITEKSHTSENIKKIKMEGFSETVVDDFSNVIRDLRERRGLTQTELATKLNEKDGLVSKLEQNKLKPTIELARKFERFFNVRLIVKEKISEAPSLNVKTSGLTIGDFVKKGS